MLAPSVIVLLRLDDRAAGADALVSRSRPTICSTRSTAASSASRNYTYFLTDPAFIQAFGNTLILTVSVLAITVIGGILLGAAARPADLRPGHRPHPRDLAVLHHADRRRAGLEEHADAPATTASSPGSRRASASRRSPGCRTIRCSRSSSSSPGSGCPSRRSSCSTALQSLDEEQKEAAEMDGANFVSLFFYIIAAASRPRRSPSSS